MPLSFERGFFIPYISYVAQQFAEEVKL